MAKRRATTELNRDNWDVEEESEEPGTFKRLSEDELKNRIIRRAKRSLGSKETSGSSPFAAFSGFAKNASGSKPFNFLKNNATGDGSSTANVPKKENGDSNGGDIPKSSEMDVSETKQPTGSTASNKQKPFRSLEYYRQLQSLNESLMKWMQLHLSKNACSDFTPVFNDYKKHLDTLNVIYPVKTKGGSEGGAHKNTLSNEESSSEKTYNAVNHEFKFGSSRKSDDETDYGANFKSNTTNTSSFSFGIKLTPTATSSNTLRPTTSFREGEAGPEKKPQQFSFALKNPLKSNDDSSVSKPFSFAMAASDKSAANSGAAETEEAEYVPPKNDFVAVKEEDAFYSKRCKLFYKKGETYVERGLGVLHLKPLDGKTQLLVRADTSLGNILLNIILSESLPMSKTGKNNVLLVCIPNPPVDSKEPVSTEAIPMLIRVKTSEDADELLEILNKHKS